jgi:GR25 family glycosyltransferase involved in LPS biosynthesis
MKIFVVHYSKLTDRKENILKQFQENNITNYEFIEEFNKEDLQDWDKLFFDDCISEPMMSLMSKHFFVYRLIAEYYENGLILEDDVILSSNFINILNKYMNEINKDYDMLFIGDGANLHIEKDKLTLDKNIYEKCLYPTSWGGDGASRCSDSYVISKKCAIKLCEYISNLSLKINLPSDWWINEAARNIKLKVYWAEPTIVTQGTMQGLFESSQFAMNLCSK